jgi:hypothetical protein
MTLVEKLAVAAIVLNFIGMLLPPMSTLPKFVLASPAPTDSVG